MENKRELARRAFDLRKDALDIIMSAGTGHIGGDMSEMEILTTLYFHVMNCTADNIDDPERDLFVLSKGHCVEALYAVLSAKGFLSLRDIMENYSSPGSLYIGHPNNKLNGIEMNTGSLGHGLPICVGMALACKKDGRANRVYTVMGDGELAEGSVWESAMAGAQYKLDNLCAVIDRNGLQISGSTDEVMSTGRLAQRWQSFGWNAIEVENGNDVGQLIDAFTEAGYTKGRPSIIIAKTVKGYGSSVMENKAKWHHRVPTQEEYNEIVKDLQMRKEQI